MSDSVKSRAVQAIVSANARRRGRRGEDNVDIVSVQAAEEYVEALDGKMLLVEETPLEKVLVVEHISIIDPGMERVSVVSHDGLVVVIDEASSEELVLRVDEVGRFIAALNRGRSIALAFGDSDPSEGDNNDTVTK